MKKLFALLLAVAMLLSVLAVAGAEETVSAFVDGTAGFKVELEPRDQGYNGPFFFAPYFEDTKAGLTELVNSGVVTKNGFVLEGEKGMNDLTQALKSSGTQITLTVADGKITKMDLFTTAGALIDHLEETADGIVAYNNPAEKFMVTEGFGPMATRKDVVFPAANVAEILSGAICVYWEEPDGFHMKPADPVKGWLTDGADHQFFVLKDENGVETKFVDAAMYSREFSEGNRPGQFINTQMNFGMQDIEVTVWFIPGTVGTDNWMPIGITGGENAKARLEAAVAYTQHALDVTVVAESEEDAKAKAADPSDFHWVKEAVTVAHVSEITGKDSEGILDLVKAHLDSANALLANGASNAEYDQAAYELFITMWGSSSDIGAVFMGTAQEGFYDVADAGAYALPAAVLK